MADASARFFLLLSSVLELDPASLGPDAARDTLEAWDSIKHMYIILALEEEFGVEFADVEIEELATLPALMQAVSAKTGLALSFGINGTRIESLRV
ncbi:MAG TPA: acyl carrier protein [Rhizomicrobium sp.]|nr:acyl carrier protein [Rhizomicrobium sp.]